MTEQGGPDKEHLQDETPVSYEYATHQDIPALIALLQRVQISTYTDIPGVTPEEIRDNYEDPQYVANVRASLMKISEIEARAQYFLPAKKEKLWVLV